MNGDVLKKIQRTEEAYVKWLSQQSVADCKEN